MSETAKPYPGPEAQELLAAILNKDEFIAVSKYCNAHHLDTDSEVLFMVAMLKLFAHVFEDISQVMIEAVSTLKESKSFRNVAKFELLESLTIGLEQVRAEIGGIDFIMAKHASFFEALSERVEALIDRMGDKISDAEGVISYLERLQTEDEVTRLSNLLYGRVELAWERRLSHLDETLASLITTRVQTVARKTVLIVTGSLILQVITIVLLL